MESDLPMINSSELRRAVNLAGIIHGLFTEEAERRDVARSVSEGRCFIDLCIQSALTHPSSLTLRATCVAVNNHG